MDEKQITQPQPQPETQPQEETSPPPEKKKLNKWLIIGLSLITLISLGIAGVFAYKSYQLTNKELELKPDSTKQVSIGPTNTPSIQPILAPLTKKNSELVKINKTWNKYVNNKLGFSMNIPKMSNFYYGSCYWKEEGGDHSYRPKSELVPVKVFKDNNTFYVDAEYYYQLGGETRENSISYYSECDKVINSASSLKNKDNSYKQGWTITARSVKNDQELEQFIKNIYGSGCKLGDKNPDKQDKTYIVSIDSGEFTDVEEAYERGCLVNYMYTIRYHPAKNLVVTWQQGQSVSFGDENNNPYDEKMSDSFMFLE